MNLNQNVYKKRFMLSIRIRFYSTGYVNYYLDSPQLLRISRFLLKKIIFPTSIRISGIFEPRRKHH